MNSLAIEIHEPRAQRVAVNDEALQVDLTDGRTIIVPLMWYPRLWHGTPQEHDKFEVIGNGAYIHWDELDEDLSVLGHVGRTAFRRKRGFVEKMA